MPDRAPTSALPTSAPQLQAQRPLSPACPQGDWPALGPEKKSFFGFRGNRLRLAQPVPALNPWTFDPPIPLGRRIRALGGGIGPSCYAFLALSWQGWQAGGQVASIERSARRWSY